MHFLYHRAIEEREAARMVALAKAETVKTAFDEARQVSSELERKRLRKIEEDRLAVRAISKIQYECLLFTLLVWSRWPCDPENEKKRTSSREVAY